MQITTLQPTVLNNRAASTAPNSTPQAPQDSVSLGHPRWTETVFARDLGTVGRNVGLSGGLAAAGALGAQVGRLGILGAVAGSAALGCYLGRHEEFQDGLSKTQNLAVAGSLAASAALIGAVPSQVGGLSAGLVAAGVLGGMGLFRGLMEVASDHNLV